MKRDPQGLGNQLRRAAIAAAAGLCAAGAATFGFAPAAQADSSGSGGGAGSGGGLSYSANVQALGLQYAFNIPGIVPLPNQNLLEDDVPFARTQVSSGPVITAQGTPYYPGDILGNFGSLLSEFAPPQFPPVPNDPFQAEAQYPATPSHQGDASFGGNPPAGSPLAPNVASGNAHAAADGASTVATLSNVQAGPPSNPSSTAVGVGPAAPAAAAGAPALDIGSVQSTNRVVIGANSVSGVATTVLRAISVAGVLDISQVASNASSQSDGAKGSPDASLRMFGVTVEGQPAYIDNQGVHVSGKTATPAGVSPQQAQNALDTTFAKDGISVRLLDATKNANGPEGVGNAGGVVVTFTHPFNVPFVPGEPTIPFPGLGNQGLPAGNYTAVTSVTLGSAISDVQAMAAGGLNLGTAGLPGAAGLGLGVGSLAGAPAAGSPGASLSPGSGSGGLGGSAGRSALGSRASSRLPLGVPVPVAWIVVAIVLCVLMTYPMLLAARWQFLSGRGR